MRFCQGHIRTFSAKDVAFDLSSEKRHPSISVFREKNLRECTKTEKLPGSTLEYASSSRDPYLAEHINRLEQVQKRVVRFVYNNYYDRQPECVTKMVQELNWEPLSSRRCTNRLVMRYKIHRGLVDKLSFQMIDIPEAPINRLFQQPATSQVYSHSFYPCKIRDCPELSSYCSYGCIDNRGVASRPVSSSILIPLILLILHTILINK